MNMTKQSYVKEPECLIDGHYGVYIPQLFAERKYQDAFQGIDPDDIAIIEMGPTDENPFWEAYWDAWNDILSNATYIDEDGETWYLYQDSDLFLVHEKWDTDLWE